MLRCPASYGIYVRRSDNFTQDYKLVQLVFIWVLEILLPIWYKSVFESKDVIGSYVEILVSNLEILSYLLNTYE